MPVRQALRAERQDVPLAHGFTRNSRGMDEPDISRAIRAGRPHHASDEIAYHMLDVMARCFVPSCPPGPRNNWQLSGQRYRNADGGHYVWRVTRENSLPVPTQAAPFANRYVMGKPG